ncbi:MAG: YafY family transcriptional regulator [Corynebacteriales bacterium]|nr:YafY family transcriptional regulator [Mycobacteriales bacterium]
MLKLLSLLQTHRYWPGTELADRLDVSPRTLRRDIERLRELGYPVDASRGIAGGYQLQAGSVLPPLLLDDEEAVAIAVGLSSAASGAATGIEETTIRALAKVVQVMPPKLRRRMDAVRGYTMPAPMAGPAIDPLTVTTLAQACRDDERLRFTYTAFNSTKTYRHVEPHRLVSFGRRWYLVAWDLDRHDWRSFRVDRLSDPAVTAARFRQRELPGGDAVAFVQAGLASRPTKHQVRVLIHAPAAHVEKSVDRWGKVESVNENSCRLSMNVDELSWPMLILSDVSAEFVVEQPAELAHLVRRAGERFIRATSGTA